MKVLPPLLFAALVGCLLLAYLGHDHGGIVVTLLAGAAAAAALVGLCVYVLRTDSRLAAEEAASLGLPGEALHYFERPGRSSLLVYLHCDRLGRVVEAVAYDPDAVLED
jgi:hypothetical protein